MTIIGSASVEIRADDRKFEADVQQATDKIKEMVVKLKLELEEGEAKTKLDELRAQIEESDGIKVKIKVDLEEARLQMDEFFAKFEEKHIDVKVKADTEEASLKIDELARDRTSTVKVKLDSTGADLQKLAGGAAGGGGGGGGAAGQNNLLTTLTTYSHIIELGTLAINGVGALSDSFVSLAGVVLSVGQNVAQVIGLAAAAPAAFGSLITVVGTAKALFTGFGGAITGNAQALAALPPSAQKAALAVGTLKDKLLLPMQHTFWDYLDGTFQNTIKITLPALKSGLDGVSLNLAHFVDDALFKFQNMAKDGTLGVMFGNLNGMLHNLELAFHPVLDAFVTLGKTGSDYLPKFGGWVYTLANQFGVFIKNASDAGKINIWIDNAVVQLKNVWGVAEGALGILKGLTLAFDKVPTLSLGGLSDELKSLAAVMQGPAFQQDASQIFGGMVQGSIQMRKAFTDMFTAIGNNSQVFGAELSAMGGLVAALVHTVMDLFTPKLTEGLINSTKTMTSIVEGLKPTAQDLGNIIGNVLELVDGALKLAVPSINTIAKTVDTVVSNLKDGVGGALPVLATFIGALLNGLAPILIVASKLLGDILVVFDGLPRPIQDVTAALGLLLALKFTVLKGFFDGLKASAKPALDDTANAATKAAGSLDTIGVSAGKATKAAEPLKEAYKDLVPPRLDANDAAVVLQYLDKATLSSKDLAKAYRDAGTDSVTTSAKTIGALKNNEDSIVSLKDATSSALAKIDAANRTVAENIYLDSGKVTKGYEDIAKSYEDLASSMGTQTAPIEQSTGKVRTYVDGLKTSVGGVGVAWHNFTDAIFAGGANLDEGETKTSKLKDSFTNLMGSIGDVSQKSGVGKGVGGALSGLMGVLGGPWGLAITGATVLLDAFGTAQADTQSKVDALSKTLDAQGRVTAATKASVSAGLLDSPTDSGGAFMRSGFMQTLLGNEGDSLGAAAKSTSEFAASVGLSLQDVSDKLSDTKTGEAYRQNWHEIGAELGNGAKISDSLAASVGLTAKQLTDAGAPSVIHFADAVNTAGTNLNAAEIATKQLADATGITSGAAQILSSNYQVLSSDTSTVSDKFNALKTNLDLVNHGQMSVMDGQEAYGKSVAATSTALQQLNTDTKGQLNTLVSAQGQFDFTKASSAALYDSLKQAKDGILQVGASTLDQAIQNGDAIGAAQQKAVVAMQAPIDALKKSLKDVGLSPSQIDSIASEFGLAGDKLSSAIGVGTEQAKKDIASVALAASAFASHNYVGVLAALPDAAKKAIADATGTATDFADGNYDAIIKAINLAPGGADAALATILGVTDGNYAAAIKALNLTAAGTGAAKVEISTVDGKTITIDANDNVSEVARHIREQIDLLHGKDIPISVTYTQNGNAPGDAGAAIRPNANGNIYTGSGNAIAFANGGLFESLAKVRKFANGAENHVAQISQGKWPVRVWAEPETGGEAYIPLSPTKRNRSENILNTVADQFGFNLVKKFDNGGLLTQHDTQQPYTATASNNGMQPPAPQINVFPSAGLDEKAIGVAAVHELNFQIQHGARY